MKQIKELELNRTNKIAEEYYKQGYVVHINPTQDKLPDFLKSFQPSLIVLKGDEKKIIEVKSRKSLSENHQTREISRLVQDQVGWKFEVVIVGIDEEISRLEETESYGEEDIIDKLEDAKKLRDLSHFEAAFLYIWSANEAALRLISEKEEIEVKSYIPSHLIKALVIEGVISKKDYEMLMAAMKMRNAIVHGYKSIKFRPDIINELLSFTEKFMKQTEEVLTA